MKLSVAIITLNEEKNIARCLQSVLPVADEIVVVDSFSHDQTESICKQFPVRFIQEKFRGHIQQKNFAMEQATHDFILALDADEELTPELTQSILNVKANKKADGYKFNRLSSYCGTFIHHGTWYPDTKIRLWDRRQGQWGGENPHDFVILRSGSKVEKLKGDLKHYTYHTISENLLQMDKFSTIAAHEFFRKGKKISVVIHLVLNPVFTFLKSYFFKLGFLDGVAGFQVAVSGAYTNFLKYSKLRFLIKASQKNVSPKE